MSLMSSTRRGLPLCGGAVQCAAMRMFLGLGLLIVGILLIPNAALLGCVFLYCGWWVYEKSGLGGDDAFIALLQVAGAIGAIGTVAAFFWQRLRPFL